MFTRLNWNLLNSLQKNLSEKFKANSTIVFILNLKNGEILKKNIKFKDFLKFFWHISELNSANNITVTDITGSVLYKIENKNTEIKPKEESGNIKIKDWNSFSEEKKEVFLKVLLSQIQYEQKFN